VKTHVFKIGDVIATWFDTGAFGAQLLLGVVIAAGPKAYRVRWESSSTNRVEQGRTTCWLYDGWKDWADAEIAAVEQRLGVPIKRTGPHEEGNALK
jgi:hypothetical protein